MAILLHEPDPPQLGLKGGVDQVIKKTPQQDNPGQEGDGPILGKGMG